MKIREIHLKHFRTFKDLKITFDDRATILIGDNGTGKSSILDALSLFFFCIFSPEQARTNEPKSIEARDVYRNDMSNKPQISIAHSICRQNLTISGDFKKSSTKLTPDLMKEIYKQVPELKREGKNDVSALENFLNETGRIVHNIPKDISDFYRDKKNGLPVLNYYSVKRNAKWMPTGEAPVDLFNPFSVYSDQGDGGFGNFFSWFKSREDLENEGFRTRFFENDLKKNVELQYDPQLNAVRIALKAFFPQFSDISVRRNPVQLVLKKDGEEFSFNQLSGGERNFLVLVADIARRLAIANPNSKEPLGGEGIILIDEIELHLHPRWQKNVLQTLMTVFKNIQFIVSTHSPLVLSEVRDANSVWILSRDDADVKAYHPEQTFGLTVAEVLEDVMGVHPRTDEVTKRLDEIMNLIDDENFIAARDKLLTLKKLTNGPIADIITAEAMITSLDQED